MMLLDFEISFCLFCMIRKHDFLLSAQSCIFQRCSVIVPCMIALSNQAHAAYPLPWAYVRVLEARGWICAENL